MYYKITNGSVTLGATTILEEIDIEIKDKDKIAIIGRNGAGKTTLLKALIDNDMLSEGTSEEKFTVFKSGLTKIDYLKQESIENENNTLLAEILSVYKPLTDLEKRIKKLETELEKGADTQVIEEYMAKTEQYKILGGYEYQKEYLTAIEKFGFTESDHHKLISSFSGGERTKIAFIKLLLSKPDLLLLDEPTNHLDIDAIIWLEEYLKNYPKSLVIVSHDRMFINKIATKIYEIEYGKTEVYNGNYTYYEIEKEKRYEKSLKDFEYQQKEIKRLQSIADRFRYKPSKASMAMSKLKQIERMVKLDKPASANTKTFNFKLREFKESSKLVLSLQNLAIGYHNILNTITLELYRGRKLGIIGDNGTGKSTLLKTIMNLIPTLGGTIQFGNNVTIGYFDQQLETLNKENTIYEEFTHNFPELTDYEIRSFLANFLFYEENLSTKISCLSGGEKVRLELCKIIIQNPNFLILDEPTNHLDILGKEKLESLLASYGGTIMFVSHDRYFIDKIADSLLVFKSCRLYTYDHSD
ncbi:MAG: ATP-binding cassette domain-containing protein, partial [Bacilli bacterium]|nr:ATP-binding cassette domain-containing protein [Bacilli bacterium]